MQNDSPQPGRLLQRSWDFVASSRRRVQLGRSRERAFAPGHQLAPRFSERRDGLVWLIAIGVAASTFGMRRRRLAMTV
jgi:hypothetical protein